MYSIALLLNAIIGVLPTLLPLPSPMFNAEYNVDAFTIFVAVRGPYMRSNHSSRIHSTQGMAPTVIVSRISFTNHSTNVSSPPLTHISGLQFNSQQGSGTEGSITANVDAETAMKRNGDVHQPLAESQV